MKEALIIIDIQNFYFYGERQLEGSIEASLKAAKILEVFRQKSLPVFHVQHMIDLSNVPKEQQSIADIHAHVKPMANEVILSKYTPGSFNGTGLNEKLKALGVDTLVICGMMSHMCVDTTTREAFDLGYKCTVLHDACATRALQFNGTTVPAAHVHATAMAALAFAFATVTSSDEFMGSNK